MRRNSVFGHRNDNALIVGVIIIIIISNISLYFIFNKIAVNNELQQLSSKSEQIVERLKDYDYEFNEVNEILGYLVPSNGMISIVDEKGNRIITVTTSKEVLLHGGAFSKAEKSEIKKINGNQYAVKYKPMILENEKVVTLEVVKNLAPLVENLSILKPILIGLSLFLTFFIISFVFFFNKNYINRQKKYLNEVSFLLKKRVC